MLQHLPAGFLEVGYDQMVVAHGVQQVGVSRIAAFVMVVVDFLATVCIVVVGELSARFRVLSCPVAQYKITLGQIRKGNLM